MSGEQIGPPIERGDQAAGDPHRRSPLSPVPGHERVPESDPVERGPETPCDPSEPQEPDQVPEPQEPPTPPASEPGTPAEPRQPARVPQPTEPATPIVPAD